VKKIFLGCALLLVAVGALLRITEPQARSEVPVIYWVIDPAPARGEQIHLFHLWQIRNGHVSEHVLTSTAELASFRKRRWSPAIRRAITDGNPGGKKIWEEGTGAADLPITVRVPRAEMRVDAASNDLNKKLVQGVSGVAGDVIEAYGGGSQMRYLASAGILLDLTDDAAKYGYGADRTFEKLRPGYYYRGRQYGVPRNPAMTMYWVNKKTFEKYGQPPPPVRWTIDEFERRGKAFVKAANPPGERVTVFFANTAIRDALRRSMGLSVFNETLTRCTLDDPRNARVMALVHKWTYKDRILPSAADLASFSTEGGWGGKRFQLFDRGNYALFACGRWGLMQLRQFGDMKLAVCEPPYAEMPNMIFSSGTCTVYRKSRHPELAKLFLAYMFSREYGMHIVRGGDGLPPNPKYARTEEFFRPPKHPNEWGCHEVFLNAAENIGIVQSFSPFVLPVVAARHDGNAYSKVMSDRATPEEAAREAAERINVEIQRTLLEFPDLRKLHRERCELQRKIDSLRKRGEKVPLEYIKNPFHRAWYLHKGWALPGSEGGGKSPPGPAARE
jgi:multiple sugar transport system substrate-binding protein